MKKNETNHKISQNYTGPTIHIGREIQYLPFAGFFCYFHQLGPLGRVSHRFAMSICMCVSFKLKLLIIDKVSGFSCLS